MAIRKHTGLIKSLVKTGKKSQTILIRKEHPEEKVTIPNDISKLVIVGYPPGHPNGPFNVDYIRFSEAIWSRGHGNTIQEAITSAKPMSKQRPRKTLPPPTGLPYTTDTETLTGNDHANSEEEKIDAKPTKPVVKRPLRKLARIRKP